MALHVYYFLLCYCTDTKCGDTDNRKFSLSKDISEIHCIVGFFEVQNQAKTICFIGHEIPSVLKQINSTIVSISYHPAI